MFEKAIRINSNDSEAHYNRGSNVYILLGL